VTPRISAKAHVAPSAIVYPNCVVEDEAEIGPYCVVGQPGFGWVRGPGGVLERMPHLAGVHIRRGATLASHVTVDAGALSPTVVGEHAHLDSHVHVGHNARIGAHAIVCAQTGLAGSVEVGEGAMLGGQVGVADHLRIGARARVAAKSGVVRDVPEGAEVAGYPAVQRRTWLRTFAKLYQRAESHRDS